MAWRRSWSRSSTPPSLISLTDSRVTDSGRTGCIPGSWRRTRCRRPGC
ncbi:Uncharacterised protein [Bordetella pertussis]|nr:Uncharacterised protein [Bordetella pertussis]